MGSKLDNTEEKEINITFFPFTQANSQQKFLSILSVYHQLKRDETWEANSPKQDKWNRYCHGKLSMIFSPALNTHIRSQILFPIIHFNTTKQRETVLCNDWIAQISNKYT
ncbi:UNKNOWN [Stylonychia lemnae]|uniref:Uncharacterized protein n=1 Tax=Stylonychia lemnae TaxID=5949 RepID=A0A078AEC8_STYLE|nr:UNKNOWN [Stylonychia lemnae]|eukprot:CDW80191.1 UNKNOWN [Stylonychia lemnae]